MLSEKRQQVVKQLEAVAHLATALAGVSADLAKVYADPSCKNVEELVGQVGDRTAHQMEVLGDIMNGMDAVTEEDDWLTPVYEAAHRLWPQELQKPFVHRLSKPFTIECAVCCRPAKDCNCDEP